MRYLIDTNIFLFTVQEQDKLSKEVQYILEDYENNIYLSSESIKEIILLMRAGRIEKSEWKTTEDVFASAEEKGFTVDYIKKEHYLTLGKIEPIEGHKDPFDHTIMAHAITNKIPLISSDTKMPFYKNQGLNLIFNRF
ncbi:MAG: type II toxin-antitoxin system VapC family toxin [Fibromonadaceae bacterium]|jgi:PIN domain nuclease of toxin-antitoxin system|nr:type II toxin-antitoxin system VapC family toxin [Fibromonadaceae bacterium]